MLKCLNCGTESLDSCQFCDECGSRLIRASAGADVPAYSPPAPSYASVTMISPEEPPAASDIRSLAQSADTDPVSKNGSSRMNAKLVIERGESPGIEFKITGAECVIGRWDADNGVFPDVDLDAYDTEAKVSRRHARIKFLDGEYVVEDLGSTNGTYVNRGRRLLPGMAQVVSNGDELIVGKTFLRFIVSNQNS